MRSQGDNITVFCNDWWLEAPEEKAMSLGSSFLIIDMQTFFWRATNGTFLSRLNFGKFISENQKNQNSKC